VTIPDKAVFETVERECQAVLDQIAGAPGRKKYAANWADCGVVEVLWCVDAEGKARWLITVSEASPSEWALALRINEAMGSRGYTVRAILEW